MVDHLGAESIKGLRSLLAMAFIGLAFAGVLVGSRQARADQGVAATHELTLPLLERAAEVGQADPEATDAQAARELPHRNLGREEAVELTETVFGTELLNTQGVFSELDVKKYLSENGAVVFADSTPEAVLRIGGRQETETDSEDKETLLLESPLPLRTEGPLGAPVPVNLSLARGEEALMPSAPLVEVDIPERLGQGVTMPQTGIRIQLLDAPQERAPSIVDESVATYPNVAPDTDLSVAPTPTGVETLTTLRSAESPDSETFHLELPAGDSLHQDGAGAIVNRDGKSIAAISPPTATDAEGLAVATTLSVEGDSITLTSDPSEGATYPILVDPVFESWDWYDFNDTDGQDTWHYQSNDSTFYPEFLGSPTGGRSYYRLGVGAPVAGYYAGNSAGYYYYVPRLKEEEAHGRTPTSYIVRMNLMHVGFHTSSGPYSPYETMGILGAGHWAGTPGHEAVWGYGGNSATFQDIPGRPEYPGWELKFENGEPGKRDQTAKVGLGLDLSSVETAWLAVGRNAEFGGAAIELDDPDAPTVANGSISPWMNQTATVPITAEATDAGLGVWDMTFELPGSGGVRNDVGTCNGMVDNPCPYTMQGVVHPSEYEPSTLPQGIDEVHIHAQDALFHTSGTRAAVLRIDHTAPSVSLSGTITEQATRGTTLPQYKLQYTATDGSEALPQSGVASTELKIDGKAVEAKYAPGCPTKSCSISKEWTLNSSAYSVGPHTLEVTAVDGVGLSTTKTQHFTISKDITAPTVSVVGGFFEGPEGWLSQKSYPAIVEARDPNGFGVTSLVLKVDGATVKSQSGACPAGACSALLSTTVNTASYKGGAHRVEVVATDGAGNRSVTESTVNIDPVGNISGAEAIATIEASEDTDEEMPPVVSSSEEESAMGEGLTPGVVAGAPGSFVSTGAPAESTIETGGEERIEIETAHGPIDITPISTSAGENGESAEHRAAVNPNTAPNTDTISRPKYNGLLQFQDIRDAQAPEDFSWEVELKPGETLKALPGGMEAAVDFEGIVEMMLIEAMPARDVLGHAVPTHLSVSGPNIVTLTVEHRKGAYIYPVTAGPSFEVGWSKVEVIKPPSPEPNAIEHEFEGYEEVSAPIPASEEAGGSQGLAEASSVPYKEEFFKKVICSHGVKFAEMGLKLLTPRANTSEFEEHCGDPWHNDPGVFVSFREGLHGRFVQLDPHSKKYAEVMHLGTPTESIGCVAEANPGNGATERQRRASRETCVWWGKTANGGGPSATWGLHITPVSYNFGESRGSCGDNCNGTPDPWERVEMPPMVYYLWADGHYAFHETRCIDCS